jgi:cation diffusion facilitator CzcD-associated flavoprotein CzcO
MRSIDPIKTRAPPATVSSRPATTLVTRPDDARRGQYGQVDTVSCARDNFGVGDNTANRTDYSVLIIGAGFSGIASAVRLREAGITDFVILERANGVGGTWRDAIYPGAEVDVPSCLYSLSFAPNPDWSTMNSPAPEILSYIENTVERFDLAQYIQFGANVTRAEFNSVDAKWRVETQDGRVLEARAVIAADGLLANSQFPAIPGIDTFGGRKILSASWERDYDFTDKRVAVIGTGASAVQIVPELVKVADHVTVFQRTPAWVVPRANFRFPRPVQKLFRAYPSSQRAFRAVLFAIYEVMTFVLCWVTPLTTLAETFAKLHLRLQIKDPVLREQLTPNYRIGCKRPLMTSQFYPALQQENAKLVPHGVIEVTERGVRSADGSEHDVDCIVFATGYDVGGRGTSFAVVGSDGQVLGDEWSHGMVGYKSVNVSGYPNLFWTMGPNSFGHGSELLFVEEQVRYAVEVIGRILADDGLIMDVRPEAQAAHNEELRHKMVKTTFTSGCQSWYLSDTGFNGVMFPGTLHDFRRQLVFQPADYSVTRASGVLRSTTGAA